MIAAFSALAAVSPNLSFLKPCLPALLPRLPALALVPLLSLSPVFVFFFHVCLRCPSPHTHRATVPLVNCSLTAHIFDTQRDRVFKLSPCALHDFRHFWSIMASVASEVHLERKKKHQEESKEKVLQVESWVLQVQLEQEETPRQPIHCFWVVQPSLEI